MVRCCSITSSLIMLDMSCWEDVGAVDRPRRLRMEEGILSMVVVMDVRIKTPS